MGGWGGWGWNSLYASLLRAPYGANKHEMKPNGRCIMISLLTVYEADDMTMTGVIMSALFIMSLLPSPFIPLKKGWKLLQLS